MILVSKFGTLEILMLKKIPSDPLSNSLTFYHVAKSRPCRKSTGLGGFETDRSDFQAYLSKRRKLFDDQNIAHS